MCKRARAVVPFLPRLQGRRNVGRARAVAILEWKKWEGHWGAKEKLGG